MSNESAFLDMFAWSEIGPALLAVSDNGYNVIVGSTPSNPNLFISYSDHPRKLVQLRPGLVSTAAGRYQLLERYFDAYKLVMMLPDFSYSSQDAIALQQIKESGAQNDVRLGNFADAVIKCSHIWASLPGNTYEQSENKLADLQAAYIAAGGTLSC